MVRKTLLFIVFFLTIAESKPLAIQKPKIFKDQNITGWMMSEKLDGIRGVWDGKHLYTKNGNLNDKSAFNRLLIHPKNG